MYRMLVTSDRMMVEVMQRVSRALNLLYIVLLYCTVIVIIIHCGAVDLEPTRWRFPKT